MEDLNFDVFEGEQKKVLINMAEQIKKQAADSVQTDDLGFEDSPVVKKDRANLSKIRKIWDNNGYLDNRS